MFNQSIIYEQPVNELTRVCLRLEHLMERTHRSGRSTQGQDTQTVMQAMLDSLSLTDRPDLRGKLIKEFIRQVNNLQRFMHSEAIDQTKLQTTLNEYEEMIQILQSQTGKFAHRLRQNEFLMSIRQHLLTPGGACSFSHPAYHHWLQQPFHERHAVLLTWLSELDELNQLVLFMLRMIRQSGPLEMHTARDGFYQASLDPQLACQLIRVIVPNTLAVYPEISVGRHGVSIRFYQPTICERGTAYSQDVLFRLSCCVL